MVDPRSVQPPGAQPPSWRGAYLRGWRVTCGYKIFTALTLFAIVCERAFSLFLIATGATPRDFAARYRAMVLAFTGDPLGGLAPLRPHARLFAELAVFGTLFLLAGVMLVGILGLMRDLLLRDGVDGRKLFRRGGRFFWPIAKFKIPIYAALAAVALPLAPLILRGGGANVNVEPVPTSPATLATLGAVAAAVAFATCFFVARILLSLGPKVIVAHDLWHVRSVYRQVLRLVRSNPVPVLLFYLSMMPLIGAMFATPALLAMLPVPRAVSLALSFFGLAVLSVFIKASSFCLYVSLSNAREVTADEPAVAARSDRVRPPDTLARIAAGRVTHG